MRHRLPLTLGLLMAGLLCAHPAFAQETEDRNRIVVRSAGEPDEIIIEVEGGESIVIVDGRVLQGDAARAYLDEHDIDLDDPANWGSGRRHAVRLHRGEPHGDVRIHGESPWPRIFFEREGNAPFMLEDFTEGLGAMDEVLRMRMPAVVGALRGNAQERAEIARMESESRRMARAVTEAEGAERERLERELRDHLAQIFDRKQELRERDAERLREQTTTLVEEQRRREQAREEIIDRRLRQLLGERDVYDW
ncbi:MAG: hypothetical protein R3247_08855 [Rhodothermales bacterium]|nr:hypothetical protein [Rhodothermales bacterium]